MKTLNEFLEGGYSEEEYKDYVEEINNRKAQDAEEAKAYYAEQEKAYAEWREKEDKRYAEECEMDMAKNEYGDYLEELRLTTEDEEEFNDKALSFVDWYNKNKR